MNSAGRLVFKTTGACLVVGVQVHLDVVEELLQGLLDCSTQRSPLLKRAGGSLHAQGKNKCFDFHPLMKQEYEKYGVPLSKHSPAHSLNQLVAACTRKGTRMLLSSHS